MVAPVSSMRERGTRPPARASVMAREALVAREAAAAQTWGQRSTETTAEAEGGGDGTKGRESMLAQEVEVEGGAAKEDA